MAQENRRMMKAYRTTRSESFCESPGPVVSSETAKPNDAVQLSRLHGVTFATMLEYRDWMMTLRPLSTLLAQRETSR
ncbi:MAG: hypothetical protein EPN26_02255 [Rhodospirillales bacterium]|nr:MAG: hypothetical protein EPN26_02255 [Rhodospirillales bacterium]